MIRSYQSLDDNPMHVESIPVVTNLVKVPGSPIFLMWRPQRHLIIFYHEPPLFTMFDEISIVMGVQYPKLDGL